MAKIKIEDQKDKDGKVIGQYAHFERVVKTENVVLNKEEVQGRIAKAEAELAHYKEILAKFTF